MSGHMDDRVRNGDSEAHPGRAMISAARSSSPRPGPYRRGAAGRPKYGPRLDRTKMLDRNPNKLKLLELRFQFLHTVTMEVSHLAKRFSFVPDGFLKVC